MHFKEMMNIFLVFLVIAKVEPSQLLPPQIVGVESENLHNVLHWRSVEAQTSPVEYAVQYFSDAMFGWKDVRWCSPTRAVHCDFTGVARAPVTLTLRVRAQSENQTSPWSTSTPFCARTQTRFGPPGVSLFTSRSNLSTLQVHVNDTSPQLRAEFGSTLEYRVIYWEESDGRKQEAAERWSSIVTLNSLKVGGSYCVQVQYVVRRRMGNLSEPVCAVLPESEETLFKRTALIVAVVVVLLGMLICACLISIHKNYDFLKKVLQPSIGVPDHILRFFERDEFDQLPGSCLSSPDHVESVACVIDDDEEEEEEEEDGDDLSGPDYGSAPLWRLGQFPASSSPDLGKCPSAAGDPEVFRG